MLILEKRLQVNHRYIKTTESVQCILQIYTNYSGWQMIYLLTLSYIKIIITEIPNSKTSQILSRIHCFSALANT